MVVSTNHWSVKYGSTTTPPRSEYGVGIILSSIFTNRPAASISATISARAANLSMPRYFSGTTGLSFNFASGVKIFTGVRLWRTPTSQSSKSWAGVIFTAPVPLSGSACSSAMIGISMFVNGIIARRPIKCFNFSFSGCTAIAWSPNNVSGRVVAISTVPPPTNG